MDGHRGIVNAGSRKAKWLCEGIASTWRVFVPNHRQGCLGSKRVRGKEDRWHATMPSQLICFQLVVFALPRVCLPRSETCRLAISTKLRDGSAEPFLQLYMHSSLNERFDPPCECWAVLHWVEHGGKANHLILFWTGLFRHWIGSNCCKTTSGIMDHEP